MTSSSKPPGKSLYGRFIPSEEINAISTWRFDNVDGTPHADEIPPPEEPPGPTPEEIEAMVAEVRQAAYEQGLAAGRAQGEADTRKALQAPMEQARAEWVQRFDALLSTLDQQLAEQQHAAAEAVLRMACDLARQVIRRELATDPQALWPVVQEALGQLGADTRPVTIQLHPSDLAELEAPLAALPAEQRPQWVANAQITPGGCLVQAAGSGVDATLEKRWQRTIANLGLSFAWDTPAEPPEPEHADENG